MNYMMTDNEVFKEGLAGVPAAKSRVSHVDGTDGILEYRGIRIEELAKSSSFIEVAYLLIWGKLPTQAEIEEFEYEIRTHRRIKYHIRDMMKCFPETGHPMDALQTSAAALGLFYARRALDDPKYIRAAVVRLLAKIPTMVAAFHMIREGNDPIQPNDKLDYASNFLYMLTEKEPDPFAAKVFDVCLTLHAEHTMNASTFSARVTASTLTDPYAVVASAVGTLAGPLHGGANEEVLNMLEEIGSVENVRPYVEKCLANKQRIMGFGHRVYKVKDPRAIILQDLAEQLFAKMGHDEYYEIAVELEKVVEEYVGQKGIYPNVDFYSGLVYRKLDIPADLFTPLFAIARVAGWLAHWKEQLSVNKIYRPTQIYIGDHNLSYVPMTERVVSVARNEDPNAII
ncbi:citrate synthase [Synechocystis sp. PCC 6803]|uniref:Citrate synthase n=1 Tax=Synechocystis sp. (strain ATCC 27184 / PCC 6803 / Kazusa) TaxID=1111708 RepID=CISY_SYNY3|nr:MULTISPECIES: citrate synthase [unclassified Synechocystis]Q59977.1 RecName: Full=Citrate synthase [Synechocystis sp. PCC 6803 substr. Kazusa]MBD2616942.1 citrate synthase [Synechocystis sp. FACHB-898]MBD2638256.1 citrate synthase [Synechocystis sp. FACHB-908]MBD2661186.1 citrate synthase [Synechocystis sp. FACHB-929]AGF52554.1 citrate synthase [Synechocystis sp. PCC 6803]QWO79713.1 citrate synthase [Synechocystis sp. PCC 6803]